jgi:Putative mono-oxygenase ydhR
VIVRLVLWNLADADMSIVQLREYLREESVPAFAEVPGLRLKLWVSDEHTERWGAVYLFESREAAEQAMPSRMHELVGKDPDLVEEFDLEASIEGQFADEELSRRGLAYE